MRQETRAVTYDDDLHLEACQFTGIAQPFPNHFHEYYVLGLMEAGQRVLSCKGAEYILGPGDILLFNPGDNHACTQSGGDTLDYRALNISRETMADLAGEVTDRRELPHFSQPVIRDEETACCLRSLHRLVMSGSPEFEKEECLLLLMSTLFRRYRQPPAADTPACREDVHRTCRFMESHYAQHISLEQLCRCAGLSRSALLRAFTAEKGITPYRYLENIRIGEARKLLEQGLTPVEAALRTGFSDQSHFANYFRRFIGLAPGTYRDIFRERR